MMTDGDPVDRANRILGMRRSDIPLEREGADRELRELLRPAPWLLDGLHDAALRDALCGAIEQAPATPPRLPGPDTQWVVHGMHPPRWSRRRLGHVLVVREGTNQRVPFYVVVDGIHTSGLSDAPAGYPDLIDAMAVAEAVASGQRPASIPALRSISGYQPPGPQWRDENGVADVLPSTA